MSLFRASHSCEPSVVAARLARGVPCLLSVGLTRPFSSREGDAPVHWLQVNNIHLEDDPAWRLTDTRFAVMRPPQVAPRLVAERAPIYRPRSDPDLDDLPF